MGLVLGIDTSSTELGLGLFRDDQAVASYSRYIKNSHAEHIAQAVALLLQSCSVHANEISHFAIAAGPGSFTGLRIGFAFLKGFCVSGGVKVLPLSSLHILAHAARRCPGDVITAIDARRDEVFFARFCNTQDSLIRVTDDRLATAAEFHAAVNENDCIVTDAMGYAQSTIFGFLEGHPGFVPVERNPFGRGFTCAALASARVNDHHVWKESIDVLPNYLRAFSAPYAKKEASS